MCERVLKAGVHRVVNGLTEEVDIFNAKAQRRKGAETQLVWRA
jgi:hypothetical protein